MDFKTKEALKCALETEYAWVDSWDDMDYEYCFSDGFNDGIKRIFNMADRKYVSVGRFRITRVAAAALLAAMLMMLAGCGFIVKQAVINWNETVNTEQGTLDVDFVVEDPDDTLKDYGILKPETPDGYSVSSEEKTGSSYCVEYSNGDDYIIYSQEKGIDNIALSIDSENNELEELEISGYKGYSSSKYGVQSITWSDGVYLYDVYGNCTLEELEQMANNLMRGLK